MAWLDKFPPVAVAGPQPIPFVGRQIHLLKFLRDPVGHLLRAHETFGDVYALSKGDPSIVFLLGAAANEMVLSSPQTFHNYIRTPFRIPDKSAISRLQVRLTAMNGDDHRTHRRLLMQAFTTPQNQRHALAIARLAEAQVRTWRFGDTIDFAEEMIGLSASIAEQCLFGVCPNDDSIRVGKLAMNFLDLVFSPTAMALPFDIPRTPFRSLLRTSENIESAMLELVERKRANMHEGTSDVLSTLIRHCDSEPSINSSELISQTFSMFVAGHETTAQTLAWTAFLLAQHPTEHKQVADEVRGILDGRAAAPEDLARLPFLDRSIKESMRLLPATPLLFFRKSIRPFRFHGISFPAGTIAVLSPLVTHRCTKRFPNPRHFFPGRWSNVNVTPFEYLPFGSGPRRCIGAGFASMAIRIVLSVILQKVRLQPIRDANISRTARSITMGPRYGMPMIVLPPDSHDAVLRNDVSGDIHELVDLRTPPTDMPSLDSTSSDSTKSAPTNPHRSLNIEPTPRHRPAAVRAR